MNLRLSSLLNRRENKVVEDIVSYFGVVQETTNAFFELVKEVNGGDQARAKDFFQLVMKGEDAADAMHRTLSMAVAEGAFFGGIREDILSLLETMDSVADSAKGAARFLESDEDLDAFALALLASDDMKSFLSSLRAAVASLGDLILALRLGKKELLSRVSKVEEHEKAADSSKAKLVKALFRSSPSKPDPVTVIQMRDFLFVADNIADYAEDASDVVLVLVAKGYE